MTKQIVDEYVTAGELAAELRIKAKTLHNWRSEGRGPKFLKLGGRVVYPRREIEAFKASSLRQSTSAPPALARGRAVSAS